MTNIKRNQFNDLLIQKYKDKDPIFDLAKSESTYPGGERNHFKNNGKKYYTLINEYTSDGGHLNEIGRYFVARDFLVFLSEAVLK